MKKGLKFGIATIAALGMICGSLYMYNTAEAASSNKTVTVTIGQFNGGNNTCTLDNYTMSLTASPTWQTGSDTKQMVCTFGSTTSKDVQLHMSGDLKTGSLVIPSGNVKLTNAANTWSSSTGSLGVGKTVTSASLSSAQTVYSKNANVIGIATGSTVKIDVGVPGGTPNGTYVGTLVLDY